MSDLKLVPPNEPTELEQRLLEAVAREAPSAEQRLRVRQALGLPSASIAPPPAPAAAAGGGLAPKVAVAGLAAGALALLLVLPWRSSEAPSRALEPSVSVAAPTPAPSAPVLLEPRAVAEEPATPLAASSAPASPSAKKGAARVVSGAEQPGAERGDLSEQLRLIESARAAVAARRADGALAALGTYRQRFPRGAFGQEASVLQIQAIDLQGNHARAAAEARAFLARHPNSPHVGVMQRIAER